eukprot:UN02723
MKKLVTIHTTYISIMFGIFSKNMTTKSPISKYMTVKWKRGLNVTTHIKLSRFRNDRRKVTWGE